MNDIDKMPSKCRDCPYWERAAEPYVCSDCTTPVKKCGGDYIKRSDAIFTLCANCDWTENCGQLREPCGDVQRINDIPAADVEPKRRWIPVTERLPEVGKQVLVYAVGKIDGFIGESVIAISERMIFRLFPWSNGEETWSPPWQYFLTDFKITHWMPLPESPKEDSDAE